MLSGFDIEIPLSRNAFIASFIAGLADQKADCLMITGWTSMNFSDRVTNNNCERRLHHGLYLDSDHLLSFSRVHPFRFGRSLDAPLSLAGADLASACR
jgi:hypothetical protein